MTDSLTGLRNTRFFDPYLEHELEAAQRDQQPLSLIMVDIDQFKEFNDTHGHPAGDEALRTFARVIAGSIRASDVAARYGGEEFIIALRHAGISEAQLVAREAAAGRRASGRRALAGPLRSNHRIVRRGLDGKHILDKKALIALS